MKPSAASTPGFSVELLIEPWRTNCRATDLVVAAIPQAIWATAVPGSPRRTVRMLAAHLHNARSRWIQTLGVPHGIARPPLVNLQTVSRRELLAALKQSARGMEAVLRLGTADGQVPPTPAYTWRNLQLDLGHVLTYFVAHEAHHRGQILMVARQLGHPLPREVRNGLWQWRTTRR